MSGTNAMYVFVFFLFSLIFSTSLLSANKEPEKHIDFVTFYDPPYIFNPAETNHQGLVQIILKTLMDNLGIGYNVLFMPVKRAELYARATPGTCIFPIEKSQEREVFFSWVSPILVSRHGLFQLDGQATIELKALEDARPFKLGSYLGSSIGDYLKSFGYHVDLTTQNEANIYKLKYGRIDLWASDILTAEHYSKSENVAISDSRLVFFTTLRAIGCHPSISQNTIISMQKELQSMYKRGLIFNIVQKFKADNFTSSKIISGK